MTPDGIYLLILSLPFLIFGKHILITHFVYDIFLTVLGQTNDHRHRVLVAAAKNIKIWFVKLNQSKCESKTTEKQKHQTNKSHTTARSRVAPGTAAVCASF